MAKWYGVSPEDAGGWTLIDFEDRLEFMMLMTRQRENDDVKKPWQGPDNG